MTFQTSRDLRLAMLHRGVTAVSSPSTESQLRVLWLNALIARFGADAVAQWQDEPDEWRFAVWRRTAPDAVRRRAVSAS